MMGRCTSILYDLKLDFSVMRFGDVEMLAVFMYFLIALILIHFLM